MKSDPAFPNSRTAPARSTAPAVRLGVCWIALCGVVAAGCSEDDGWVETRHARIKGEYGVCAGLEAYVDERIELTAEWLELEPGPRVDIYFGQSYVDEQQENYDYRIGGLARTEGGDVSVYARFDTLGHELVHAVRFSNGLVLPALIDEGVALLYGGGEFDPSGGGVSYAIPEGATLPDDAHSATVGVAATFTGWLHETLSREEFIGLINDPELDRGHGAASNWQRIEAATGMSKDVLEERWASEAQFYYSEVPRCRPERTHRLEVGELLHIEDRVSCDDSPTTFGPYLRSDGVVTTAQRWHCFPLDETITVRVTASGPPGTEILFSSAPGSCLRASPLTEATALKRIELGTTAEFTFGDCSWRTTIRSEADTVGDVSITLEAIE